MQEYLKVVDELTIDKSKRLERENEMLKVKKSEYESLKEQLEQHKEAQAARDERLRERLYRLSKKLMSEQEEEGTIPLSPEEQEQFEHAMKDD